MARCTTLYVSDLDGTLLGSDSLLSAATVELLNESIARGAMVTIATARTPATVMPIMRDVNAKLPFIVFSGAAMWSPGKQGYSNVRPFGQDVAAQVLQACSDEGINPFVYTRHGDHLVVWHAGQLAPQEQQFVEQRRHLAHKRFVLGEPFDGSGEPILVFAMRDYSALEPLCQRLKSIDGCKAILYRDIFDPSTGLLEIHRHGTSKALAISQLANATGAERIVVFGDNLNDIEMMGQATWSVAVGNAVQQVKDAANEVIGPNTANSVAQWILNDINTRQKPDKTRLQP